MSEGHTLTAAEAPQPTALDIAVSKACTQSGAFALLLSMALVSLIPYWLQGKQDKALGTYVALRLELATAVDLLDESVTWQKYKATDPTESASIAQLLDTTVKIATGKPTSDETQQKKVQASSHKPGKSVSNGRPLPPTNFTGSAGSGIPEIETAADFLVQLDDPDMLTISRGYSTFVDLAIYRWTYKRNTLVYRNTINNPNCAAATVRGLEFTKEQAKKAQTIVSYVVAVGKDVLLSCLTVQDLRELALFELPEIPDTTNYQTRTGKEVDISPGALPRNLYMASIFSEGLLLFVIVYFSAFTHEAISPPSFPGAGTLFGAFSVSWWTLAMFTLALLTPVIASGSVAVASRRLPLIIGSVFVSSAVLSVFLALSQRSYFRPLAAWPVRFRRNGSGPAVKPESSAQPENSAPEKADPGVNLPKPE